MIKYLNNLTVLMSHDLKIEKVEQLQKIKNEFNFFLRYKN